MTVGYVVYVLGPITTYALVRRFQFQEVVVEEEEEKEEILILFNE